jgi:hypothetical protein
VLQQAVDHADPVEPGRYRKPPEDRRGLEPANLLHPPDAQLQMRATRGQRVQTVVRTQGQVAAQVGFGVVPAGAFESGEVGGYRQPKLISEWRQVIGRDKGGVDESLHG